MKAKLEIINAMRYDYPFGNDLKIMFIVSIENTSITHIHTIPQFIISVFRDVSCEHRQGIAKMFASVIVKEMILDNFLRIGNMDMSDVENVIRMKYPFIIMRYLEGFFIFQNFVSGVYSEESVNEKNYGNKRTESL